jgi:protein-L-isoaspartate(D-aspartate) O-methyltransferase
MNELEKKRHTMIEHQLKARGIKDRAVLQAMREVPRHAFLPESMAGLAYEDSPLPIGRGQTISQPYIVAMMTELLELSPDARVLEIGTGSGYAAAVLSRISSQVFTIERYEELAASAENRFRRLGYDNIRVLSSDGSLGWPEHAPYDGIVVTAGSPDVPQPLKEQLAVGGRLVIPTGSSRAQELRRIRRTAEDAFEEEALFGVRFVPLVGAAGWQESQRQNRLTPVTHSRSVSELIGPTADTISSIGKTDLSPGGSNR